MAVPDGDAVRFVVQTPRRRALSVTFRTGDALPAERCAPGALFAAEWDERASSAGMPACLLILRTFLPCPAPDTAATGPGPGAVPGARGRSGQERLGPGRSARRARADRRRRAGTGRIRERRRRAQRGQPHQPALGRLAARPSTDRDARHAQRMTAGTGAVARGPAGCSTAVPRRIAGPQAGTGTGVLQSLARGLTVLASSGHAGRDDAGRGVAGHCVASGHGSALAVDVGAPGLHRGGGTAASSAPSCSRTGLSDRFGPLSRRSGAAAPG